MSPLDQKSNRDRRRPIPRCVSAQASSVGAAGNLSARELLAKRSEIINESVKAMEPRFIEVDEPPVVDAVDVFATNCGTRRPRKSKGKSPTARSLEHWRAQGYLCDVVERRVPHCFTTRDAFGFIDILCVKGEDIVGVQTTSSGNLAARVDKITSHENYPLVVKAMRVVVEGWRKNAKGRWVRREVEL